MHILFDSITLIQLEFPKIVIDNLQLHDFYVQSRIAVVFLTFRCFDYMCFVQDDDIPP